MRTALVALLVTLVASSTSSAVATPPLMVTQTEAKTMLERYFDHATCAGVARLGSRTWKGKREFVYFDCQVQTVYPGSTQTCSQRQKVFPGPTKYKATMSRHGLFYMRIVTAGPCVG